MAQWHEKPLLVGNLSKTVFQKYPMSYCRPGWWIFKAGFNGCCWQIIQGPMVFFSSDFSFADSSANLLNKLLNKSLGSASFLCSTFTWMQIHTNLTSAGNMSHLALTGWGKKPYSNPFPDGLPTREMSSLKSVILLPACRSAFAGELKLLQTGRTNISCWKYLPKLNLLVALDGFSLGTIPVGLSLCHQADSQFYFNQLFSLPVMGPPVNCREEWLPLEALPYLESAFFSSSCLKRFSWWLRLADACRTCAQKPAWAGQWWAELKSQFTHRAQSNLWWKNGNI